MTKPISILLIIVFCSCGGERKETENTKVEYDEIFGDYVNVKNPNDSLKIYSTHKYENITWYNNKIYHFEEGKFDIMNRTQRNNILSFCYIDHYGILDCRDILKKNGKIQIYYGLNLYEK